ncbi:MAG: DNA-3-methyladenine glycosylase [Candidatus Sungbacteria bacterium]|nr:DNA-3-methyladenine glycosylase [Candidatus Sungbacteria bacterium]
MHKLLSKDFFNRPTLQVAQELLGKFLVRKIGHRKIFGIITEVEAYIGPKDKASHASRGRTKRTEVMFGKPGYWYVYLIYGMYYCLNIVTEKEHYPAAVLIRSIVTSDSHSNILKNIRIDEVRGPGKVCKYFKIDKRFNAKHANKKTGLWIAAHSPSERASPNKVGREDYGIKISPRQIKRGKRIGVDYAGKWKDKPWRFYVVG